MNYSSQVAKHVWKLAASVSDVVLFGKVQSLRKKLRTKGLGPAAASANLHDVWKGPEAD